MSGRSGAISHTTLHEATKGNRLPSWETTVEFVKACGADPAAYRARWESANRAVRSTVVRESPTPADVSADRSLGGVAGTAEPRTAHVAMAPRPAVESPASVPAPPPRAEIAGVGRPVLLAPRGRRRFRPTRPTTIVLATAAAGVGAAVLVVALVDRGSGPDGQGAIPSGDPSVAAHSPAVCPVLPTNPPSAPPAHSGDASVFVADVTLPDCTRVNQGETVVKVWRIKNVGTVTWKGYSLHRLDLPQRADQCQTISEVPIADTPPGEMVDIRTEVTTPRKPGLCYVRFKMADASGKLVFPGSRPVNFQIIVN